MKEDKILTSSQQKDKPSHDVKSTSTTQDTMKNQPENSGSEWSQKFRFNTKLLTYKVFYFMFVAGFGATFPYLALYFKQLGLNAEHVGIISGVRPLIQFSSGPFWSILADTFKARRAVLLISIISWLIMTLALLIPHPQNMTCKISTTTANRSLQTFHKENEIGKRTHIFYRRSSLLDIKQKVAHDPARRDKEGRVTFKREIYNISTKQYRQNISSLINLRSNEKVSPTVVSKYVGSKHSDKKENSYFNLVRDPEEIQRVFIILLWLTIIGEFFEAPSFIMTDTAVLQQLGDKRNEYGKTRLYGSLGYSVASFGVGALLDMTHYTYCGESMNNYNIMFYIFAAIMSCAFIYAAFAFKFEYNESDSEEENTTQSKNNIVCVFKIFLSFQYSFFITLTWFLGLAEGLIFNFLNWYLEDLGASKLLMGVATVLRCSTIIFGFYYNSWVIEKFRYRAVFFWVLFSYMFSFVAYSILRDPWWILPIELIQGFTYGTAWATCVTYMSVVTPANGAATAQGILHGVYWGLGGGLGAIFGGVIIHEYGAVLSFRAGSVASSIMLILFCLFEWWMARKKEKEELHEDIKKDLDLEEK